jgi:hypothetical protein
MLRNGWKYKNLAVSVFCHYNTEQSTETEMARFLYFDLTAIEECQQLASKLEIIRNSNK